MGHKGDEKRNQPGVVFDYEAEEKRYKRYQRIQYAKLVFKALLFFLLGLAVSFLLKL